MKKIAIEIKWAILFTIMSLLWMVLEKLCGLHGKYIDYHLYLTNLYMIPAVWVMVLALKDKKKNYYNGQMSYKQGLISGVMVSLIVALLSPLTQWIISYVITPEYFPNVIKRSVEIGYYKTTAEAEANFNYKNYAIQSTIAALVMGTLTTAITMIFIRTKNKSTDDSKTIN
ncbi:DUF4199 domain-containing protein [Sphingobacterium sp. SRCM116780]|uniref:DUF4199 domain-containing protein n=1 Tax=Sphingobacterium sp. SRCM116780 TaxID=2907623 RepID=UPI001F2BE0FC|nr:DUF4199 domain-containing protein [Sphingobacterium sp. SRCM116780]UIR57299.1 DUF4199 domain-containing protein [Sphingobacterium sp. SRCM116780]